MHHMAYYSIYCLLFIPATFLKAEILVYSRGGTGDLLQLFDAREQQVRPFFLANSSLASVNIEARPKGGSIRKSVVVQSFSEFVSKSSVNAEAKLDLLLSIGTLDASGAISIDSGKKTSARSIFAIVEIVVEKFIEQLSICDEYHVTRLKLSQMKKYNVKATHVIVGKIYGLRSVVKIEMKDTENKSFSELEGQLRGEVNGIFRSASLMANVHGSVKKSNTSTFSSSKVDAYCNLVKCPPLPESFDELESFIRELYRVIDDDDFDYHGNEVYYVLADLNDIRNCANFADPLYEYHHVEIEITSKISRSLTQADLYLRQLFDTQLRLDEYIDCIPSDDYNNISNQTEQSAHHFAKYKEDLKKTVIDVRNGLKQQTEISDIINQFFLNEMNPSNVLSGIFKDNMHLMRTIFFYDSQKQENVQCLPKTSSLVNLLPDSRIYTHFFLAFDNETFGDSDAFLAKVRAFLNKCKNCIKCKCYSADCSNEFSFCSIISGSGVLAYKDGLIRELDNSLNDQFSDLNEVERLKRAMIYSYLSNLKTLLIAKNINEKVEYYYNHTTAILAQRYKVNAVPVNFKNIDALFREGSILPGASNRTILNDVEKFVGRVIVLNT